MKNDPKNGSLAPFMWVRDPAGYRWETGYQSQLGRTAKEIRASAVDVLVPNSDERAAYEPPANLFVILKDTPPSKDGVLDFANTFGLLDLNAETSTSLETFAHERLRLGLRRPDPPRRDGSELLLSESGGGLLINEPLAKWKAAIGAMNYAVSRWDVARGEPTEDKNDSPSLAKIDLQQVFYENLRGAVAVEMSLYDLRSTGRTLTRFASVPTVVVDHPRMGRVTLNRADYDRKQHGRIVARPKPPPRPSGPETKVRLPTRFEFLRVAQSLLGFCWWQLKLAVQGDVRFRRCLACGIMMTVVDPETPVASHVEPRQSRKTCSPSCRVRLSYYGALYDNGDISVAEITKRLGGDPRDVRAWAVQRTNRKGGR